MFGAVDALALAQGDVAEAVGDVTEATGKVGDIVVALDACNGPARGRVVVEAKDRKLSKPGALSELDRAMAERSADFAVLVVPTDEELPSKLEPLREYNGDKLVVALDPEQGTLALELGYRLARARVLMKRSDADGIDAGALRDTIERALGALTDERKIKMQLTGARRGISTAYELVEAHGRARARPPAGDRRAGAPAGGRARHGARGGRGPAGALATAAAARRSSWRGPCRCRAWPARSPCVPPSPSPPAPRSCPGRACA